MRKLQHSKGDVELERSWLFPILDNNPPKGHSTPASCERVRQFLLDLKRLDALRQQLGTVRSVGAVESKDAAAEFHRMTDQINTQLERYRWTPELSVSESSSGRIWYRWDERTEACYHENLAVRVFLDAFIEGRINRYRPCAHCGNWFFAFTDHQKYCDVKCRVKDHSQSDDFKKKRADYMRKRYRPLMKHLEQKRNPKSSRKAER